MPRREIRLSADLSTAPATQEGEATVVVHVDCGTQSLGGAVHNAAKARRGPRTRTPECGLGAAGQLGVAVGAGHRDHFVRTGDDGGDRPTQRSRLGDRLDESRMVAAEIGEDIGNAGFLQRLEHRALAVYIRSAPDPGRCSALALGR
jgi:hypothetical protein